MHWTELPELGPDQTEACVIRLLDEQLQVLPSPLHASLQVTLGVELVEHCSLSVSLKHRKLEVLPWVGPYVGQKKPELANRIRRLVIQCRITHQQAECASHSLHASHHRIRTDHDVRSTPALAWWNDDWS